MIKICDEKEILKKHITDVYTKRHKKKSEPFLEKNLDFSIKLLFDFIRYNSKLKSILVNPNENIFLMSANETLTKHTHFLKFCDSKNRVLFSLLFIENLFKPIESYNDFNKPDIMIFETKRNLIIPYYNNVSLSNLRKINILNNPLFENINRTYITKTRQYIVELDEDIKENISRQYFRKTISKTTKNNHIKHFWGCLSKNLSNIEKGIDDHIKILSEILNNDIYLESEHYEKIYNSKRTIHKILNKLNIEHFFEFFDHDEHNGLFCIIKNRKNNNFDFCFELTSKSISELNNNQIYIISYDNPSTCPIQRTDFTFDNLRENLNEISELINLQRY